MVLTEVSPVLLWFLSGLVFLGLELLLPGLIVFFFGIGAWCAALVLYFMPMSLASQLLIFLGASLLCLILLRSTLKKVFLGRTLERDAMDTPLPPDGTAEVIEDILPPALGKVKYRGSFWQASALTPLPKGTVVRVLEKQNLTIMVGPIDTQGEG
ncbi:NfeD family protein [Desulfobulbus rhabdoformis]|nr:NfeD family protein [Desulfobulbus rhabdoformis]